MSILISCAGDNEMAIEVHDRLSANVGGDISLIEDEIELKSADKHLVRKALDSYVSEAKLEDYSITEFGEIFMIGIKADSSKFMLHTCEYCGYQTPYGTDLYTHRTLHMGYFVMLGFL